MKARFEPGRLEVGLLIAVVLILQGFAIHGQSLPGDDAYHLLAGQQALFSGQNLVNYEHPPLVKLVASPTWRSAAFVGFAAGIALASKFSGLLLMPSAVIAFALATTWAGSPAPTTCTGIILRAARASSRRAPGRRRGRSPWPSRAPA